MKKLTYDQVEEKFIKYNFPLPKEGLAIPKNLIRALIDSINENIDWSGYYVISKTDLDLQRSNMKARCKFLSGSEFKVIIDKGEYLSAKHKNGALFEISREWVYLKNETR